MEDTTRLLKKGQRVLVHISLKQLDNKWNLLSFTATIERCANGMGPPYTHYLILPEHSARTYPDLYHVHWLHPISSKATSEQVRALQSILGSVTY